MITIYNSDLDNDTVEALKQLLNKDISPRIAFNLLKITTLIDTIISNKAIIYDKILAKYAQKGESDPNQFIVKEENIKNFQSEMEELLSIKHELPLDKINFEDLKLEENITAMTFNRLRFLFNLDLPEVITTGGDRFRFTQDSLQVENNN